MKTSRSLPLVGLILAAAAAVHAGPLAPTKASELATVLNSSETCNAGAGRVLNFVIQGDGSITALVIPEHSVLVVTAWEWCETSNPSGAFVSLIIDGPGGLVPFSSVLREPLTTACSRADLGPGVRVASGSQLCASPVSANAFIKAHGYITKDK
jgi:hypothetical protein